MELLDEHEQGERVRTWLRENGTAILGGIALGVAAIFSWQWWQGSQERDRIAAADQYHRLSEAVAASDADGMRALAGQLQTDFPGNPYAMLAALHLAELELGEGNSEAAAQTLEHARTTATDPALRGVATLRLARVRIARGEFEQALTLLADAQLAEDYAGLAAELRGDALAALGREHDARGAYAEALSILDIAAPNRSIIEMKLAAVGGRAESPET
ncbi:MAG TPA: tetratricopeptide repeat protein [Xanthomonadaceae bacterium]|nr:tetratricopeptide repeat protein [Xanthomonadaceae bacterium]